MILRIILFSFLLVKIFLDEAATSPAPQHLKNDATCMFLEITVNIVNKINVTIHPNECKLYLFPISKEIS